MQQITGNIWEYHDRGFPICVTTNGFINKSGECVMGRGIALQAKRRYPGIQYQIAAHIEAHGNVVGYFNEYDLFTFPTKHVWWENSDIELIKRSARQLIVASDWLKLETVYLVRPGCSNGKLNWEDVEPVLSDILWDDRFVVVQN